MRTERRLLNKYDEFLSVIAKATLTFSKKDEIGEVNRILKEILALKKRMIREQLSSEDNLQMRIKFKRHGR